MKFLLENAFNMSSFFRNISVFIISILLRGKPEQQRPCGRVTSSVMFHLYIHLFYLLIYKIENLENQKTQKLELKTYFRTIRVSSLFPAFNAYKGKMLCGINL